MIGTTGPKISPEDTAISEVTPVRIVGVKKQSPALDRVPPANTMTPASRASATSASILCTAARLISGPIVVPGSAPSPTTRTATRSASFETRASCTLCCTNIRLVQTQVCPELRNLEAINPSTAASRSASSNTMKGALPPSSRLSRVISAASSSCRAITRSCHRRNTTARSLAVTAAHAERAASAASISVENSSAV